MGVGEDKSVILRKDALAFNHSHSKAATTYYIFTPQNHIPQSFPQPQLTQFTGIIY